MKSVLLTIVAALLLLLALSYEAQPGDPSVLLCGSKATVGLV